MLEHFSDIVDVDFTANMEEKLDSIEDGNVEWKKIIAEFYGPFSTVLEKAEDTISKIEIKDEVSDVECDKCGRMMVIKTGRFGRFLACPGYPDCRNAKPLIVNTGAKCPDCGGEIIERKSKKGHVFYGCSEWPKCNFMSWDAPADKQCPECGKTLFKKKGGKLVCMAKGCGYEKSAGKKKNDE